MGFQWTMVFTIHVHMAYARMKNSTCLLALARRNLWFLARVKYLPSSPNFLSKLIISKEKSEQSIQWLVRNSLDKIWAVLGTPVGQPRSPTFWILKPCCTTSHPYLPYPLILEKSVQWLLRSRLEKIWVERRRNGEKTISLPISFISLPTSFWRLNEYSTTNYVK